ncbi:hypothetical protein GJ744_011664 [Endocarpon pusillum]|uniref:Uncharacterized protein n=1 Tax=Endocarpon pusillum TaxID=364733 RepID=A0A8H7E392_9EURO|nr:hypothetical protein GJ744_011664 [Endocarpon pusillum]
MSSSSSARDSTQNSGSRSPVHASEHQAEQDTALLTEENLQILQGQIQPSGGVAGIGDVPYHQIETEKRIENWLEDIRPNMTGSNSSVASRPSTPSPCPSLVPDYGSSTVSTEASSLTN